MMNKQPNSLSPSNAWMVVYIATSDPEAYIVAGRLNNEGIKTFVHQEPIAKAYGFSIGTLGEIKVLVSAEDYDWALAILDEDVEGDNSEDTDIALEDEYDDDYDEENDYDSDEYGDDE
jgi:hypothetical protein